ncbi:MAG: hypothetical protein H0V97_07995 [Actinobacteria bacterium]|nr:hypothetical protein [Actinomycetota bacterium]
MVISVASYYETSPNLLDKKFRALRGKDPNAQLVYLYQLFCRHRNSEGLFLLPKPYVVADTAMRLEEVHRAFEALQEAQVIDYDVENEIILDRQALKFLQPRGPKQITGAVRVCIEQLPKTRLKAELLKLAYIYAKDFADAIVEADGALAHQALPDPGGHTPSIPLPNPTDRLRREELSAKQLRDKRREEPETQVSDSGFEAFKIAKQHLVDNLGAEVVQEVRR